MKALCLGYFILLLSLMKRVSSSGISQPSGTTEYQDTISTTVQSQSQVESIKTLSCYEFEVKENCLTNALCCYVANSYGSYKYQGCINVKNPDNYETFCYNFWGLSVGQKYTPEICRCGDVYEYKGGNDSEIFNHMSYLRLWYSVIFCITLLIIL